jgi:hypothetical protein
MFRSITRNLELGGEMYELGQTIRGYLKHTEDDVPESARDLLHNARYAFEHLTGFEETDLGV